MRHPLHGDAGLQPERTTLAWTRTAATLTVVSLLCLRYVPGSFLVVQVVCALSIGIAAMIVVTARRRYEKSSALVASGRPAPPFLLMFALTSTVVTLAVVAAVCVAIVR